MVEPLSPRERILRVCRQLGLSCESRDLLLAALRDAHVIAITKAAAVLDAEVHRLMSEGDEYDPLIADNLRNRSTDIRNISAHD